LRLQGQILERERILQKNFSSAAALGPYVDAHKQSGVVKRKIQSAVTAKGAGQTEQEAGNGKTWNNQAYVAAYQKLVAQSAVLVNDIFTEMPPLATLCELQWFFGLLQQKTRESKKGTKDQDEILQAVASQSK